jgi:lysyl-tRNA synthetase class II
MTTFAPMTLNRVRSDLCQKWREYLLDGFGVEVVTPILHPRPDIAPVRQFTTTHPSTGELAHLRIAPTEYLKRLIAAGEEQVFEFSTNFRDDPADATHLPEFVSLEVMAKGATCADMEQVVTHLCQLAVEVARRYHPAASPPAWVQHWEAQGVHRLELANELKNRFGVMSAWLEQPAIVRQLLVDLGGSAEPDAQLSTLMDRLVTLLARRTSGAVLICGFPDYLGGPAAPHATLLGFKQRSELFIDGLEVANMSSNLTDGRALWQWHKRGMGLKAELGIPTNEFDDDLLSALDGKLPASAVLGIGVERMLQAALNLPDIRVLR